MAVALGFTVDLWNPVLPEGSVTQTAYNGVLNGNTTGSCVRMRFECEWTRAFDCASQEAPACEALLLSRGDRSTLLFTLACETAG